MKIITISIENSTAETDALPQHAGELPADIHEAALNLATPDRLVQIVSAGRHLVKFMPREQRALEEALRGASLDGLADMVKQDASFVEELGRFADGVMKERLASPRAKTGSKKKKSQR